MQDDNGQGIDLCQLLLDLSALLTAFRKNFLDFGNIVQPISEGLNEPRDPSTLLGEYCFKLLPTLGLLCILSICFLMIFFHEYLDQPGVEHPVL